MRASARWVAASRWRGPRGRVSRMLGREAQDEGQCGGTMSALESSPSRTRAHVSKPTRCGLRVRVRGVRPRGHPRCCATTCSPRSWDSRGRRPDRDQVAGRKSDVAAALRELEELGLAIRRPKPDCGWEATPERPEADRERRGPRDPSRDPSLSNRGRHGLRRGRPGEPETRGGRPFR